MKAVARFTIVMVMVRSLWVRRGLRRDTRR
jgi:hypothetical protein